MAEELDKEKRFPYEIVAKLDELGLMGVPYPEEDGGGGADTLSYALVIEELARFPMDARAARATAPMGKRNSDRTWAWLLLVVHCGRFYTGGADARLQGEGTVRSVGAGETARVLPTSPASAGEERVHEEKAALLREGFADREKSALDPPG